MSHRTTPAPQFHKLETSTIDGEVRGACTCGWHHRGWVRALATVREAHERHVAAVTYRPWKPVGRSSKTSNVDVWLVQRECANGTAETYRKKGGWLRVRPSLFASEATAQAMADELNATRESDDDAKGVEPQSDPREPGFGRFAIMGVVVAAALPFTVLTAWGDGAPAAVTRSSAPPNAIPMAVLGDSNSQSYQDRVSFPPGGSERGGAQRAHTFQWTEVLARLRGNQIDLGPWVRWGRPWSIAWARELVGLQPSRSPIKEDYLYNFANSGAGCRHLMGEHRGQPYRQAPRLVALMDKNPEQWRRGVVVISIGPNDWNQMLDLQARDPSAPQLRSVIDYCTQQIRETIDLIHASHPSTRILLSGLGNEADDPENFGKYRDAVSMANIRKALAGANVELRKIAEADPRRIAYVDYDAWFIQRWGQRGPNGEPDYKTVQIGSRLRVTNTAGDTPDNALLNDHHAGTAFNAMWAQAIVKSLRDDFGMPLTPMSDEEVIRFVTG